MHEVGYCEGVLEAVERRAAGRRVARVGVRIGVLHRVVPDAFEQSFQLVAAGGIAEGAGTDVTPVAVRARCLDCGARFDAVDPAPACATCGSLDVEVQGGDELVLEWIQYREEGGAGDVSRHPG